MGMLEERLILRRRHGSSAGATTASARSRFGSSRSWIWSSRRAAVRSRTADALRAYEAHRAVDTVLRAVSHYILGERKEARRRSRRGQALEPRSEPQIQRGRMLALALGLHALVRLPRMRAVSRLFARHWHGTAAPADTG